jgi:glycosyltransferase involved in cell wall biosynthesis
MPTSSLPLVSVVTPAYNEEKYLGECIESVLGQSYTHWDYLIVNNCSTDGTAAIAQKYAAADPRIRVVTNHALVPAVANFNVALRQISPQSKYCKMVLGDDWIFPECLERMVGVMEEHPSVGIVGSYGLQGQCVVWQGLSYRDTVISGHEICRQRLLGGRYVFGTPTSVLFRSDLVRARDPFYNEANVHAADSEACFELLKSSDFAFIHQILTFSREREGSLLEASRDLNASAADLLHELVVYGPEYLAPEEHRQRLGVLVSEYYDFLAASLLERRGREFWRFHKSKLRENGIEFSEGRLLGAVIRKMGDRFRVRRKGSQPRWGL